MAVTAVRGGCGGRLSSGCVRERLRVHLSGERRRRPYRQTTCSCLSLTTRVVTGTVGRVRPSVWPDGGGSQAWTVDELAEDPRHELTTSSDDSVSLWSGRPHLHEFTSV